MRPARGLPTLETVVYVHGLWATPVESLLFRHRLAHEFRIESFRYPTVTSSMQEVTDRLASFVGALSTRTLHLVGHSLGGLVIHRFLERHPDQPPGRVVFLGVPVGGSGLAENLARWDWSTAILGRCVAEELLVARARSWTIARALGIIAGTRPIGFEPLLGRSRREPSGARGSEEAGGLEHASDGVVTVRETRIAGATDYITVRASHVGLLLSARVANETCLFLREGHFALSRPPDVRSSSVRRE